MRWRCCAAVLPAIACAQGREPGENAYAPPDPFLFLLAVAVFELALAPSQTQAIRKIPLPACHLIRKTPCVPGDAVAAGDRRVHVGAYRATPSRRVMIPKPDGGERPLGIAALEDKIVQKAVVDGILTPIYEAEFLGFSYGFRPGRSAHDALDALAVGIERCKVNWILDADVAKYFDTLDRDRLVDLLGRRIGDGRLLRLIRKWLNAGVLEEGLWADTGRGTPQGAVISPVLANVYLHYVLDAWVRQWRQEQARGEVIMVRYADDFVLGFQHRGDAVRLREALEARLADNGLALHPEKTRLIEFGRFAAASRAGRGEGKPKTFDFLGFTHYCGKTRQGRFQLGRKPIAKRMSRKLKGLKRCAAADAARGPEGHGAVAGAGVERMAELLRRSGQLPVSGTLPGAPEAHLGADAATEVTEGPHRLEEAGRALQGAVAGGPDPTPMAESTIRR